MDNSQQINQLKNKIFSKEKSASTEDTILWVSYEFKMPVWEMMEHMTIPQFYKHVDFLNKMYAEKNKANKKK